jgi:hypothetical protein
LLPLKPGDTRYFRRQDAVSFTVGKTSGKFCTTGIHQFWINLVIDKSYLLARMPLLRYFPSFRMRSCKSCIPSLLIDLSYCNLHLSIFVSVFSNFKRVKILTMSAPVQIILASNSPRRRELLALTGWRFIVSPADIDETPNLKEQPEQYVRRLAHGKATACTYSIKGVILAADTIVVDGNQILGKPVDGWMLNEC